MSEILPGFSLLSEIGTDAYQVKGFPKRGRKKKNPEPRKFYIETYGCAMNFSDTEIITSVLVKDGFLATDNFLTADLILINTCSIRDNAEQKVRNRLRHFRGIKNNNPAALIGVLGCMAERLKSKLLEEEKIVDLVAGPDSYRDLPKLIARADDGQKAVNVLLSRDETYGDINPVRVNSNGVSAFISITRGCNNMCSFCVVPFTRGRERSRDAYSIISEARDLFNDGYREVTLLGQNVDSYSWKNEGNGECITFARLLEMVAQINPILRVRFSTSHPKDISDEVLYAIKKFPNICKHIHLPVQSGCSKVLERMNRTYDRSWYLGKIERIRELIPDCGISTDIITGFCGETDEDHLETLSLMDYVRYDLAYMFKYSERPGTPAAKKFIDNVPEEIKSVRLSEIVDLQHKHQAKINATETGKIYEVLVEGTSKRSENFLVGRNTHNKVIVFPDNGFNKGDYVNVKITDFTSATLIGNAVKFHYHKHL
ncbi:MAG: tRNA (N6-isopentenyl adenosine(37)-C2)-methylthiotransferase MiaB [Chitinophagales bacterium]